MPNRICFTLLLSCIILQAYSQNDSISLPDDSKYDTIYRNDLRNQENSIRQLWKINLAHLGVFMPNMAYETKIGRSWSSETSLAIGVPEGNGYLGLNGQWELSQQLKYYFNLNRREKMGKYTNGFSANYLSLVLSAGEIRGPKPGYHHETIIDGESFASVGLRYGMQRRIGRIGYIEPYFELNYRLRKLYAHDNNAPLFNFSEEGYFSRWMCMKEVGFKAGFSLESIKAGTLMDLNAVQDKLTNHMWKLNLADMKFLVPNLGYEVRVYKNLSSESYLKFGVTEKPTRHPDNSSLEPVGNYYNEFEFEQQFRCYFRFRHPDNSYINDFSGNYLSVFGLYKTLDYPYDDNFFAHFQRSRILKLRTYGAGLKIGVQKKISDIGYFDLFCGAGYLVKENPRITGMAEMGNFTTYTRQGIFPLVGIRAGFALDGRLNKR